MKVPETTQRAEAGKNNSSGMCFSEMSIYLDWHAGGTTGLD